MPLCDEEVYLSNSAVELNMYIDWMKKGGKKKLHASHAVIETVWTGKYSCVLTHCETCWSSFRNIVHKTLSAKVRLQNGGKNLTHKMYEWVKFC